MEKKSLRINSGITIEVNDDGDCIVAYVTDQNFVKKFYDMVEKMNQTAEYMGSDEVDSMEVREKLKVSMEKSREMIQEIDLVFGERASEKIFGAGVVPSGYALGELFEQLIPVFQGYADERQKKIAEKYDRNRKGNREARRHDYRHQNNRGK